MSQLKLTADSGGGTVAIKGPASTAGNAAIELTVPGTGNATLATTSDSFGKILQVKQSVKTDVSSRGGSSGSETAALIPGLTVNITPSASTSKIYVMVNIKQGNSNNTWVRYQLYRDSTAIYLGDTVSGKQSVSSLTYINSDYNMSVINENFLDSPNTTSQITYQVYWAARDGSGNVAYINRTGADNGDYQARCASSITVMEVAA